MPVISEAVLIVEITTVVVVAELPITSLRVRAIIVAADANSLHTTIITRDADVSVLIHMTITADAMIDRNLEAADKMFLTALFLESSFSIDIKL